MMYAPGEVSPAAERVRRELAADPGRPDTRIAAAAGVSPATAARVRRMIETGRPLPRKRPPRERRPRIARLPPVYLPGVAPQPVELTKRGLCASGRYDPNLWVTDRNGPRHVAASICQQCPVRELCAGWALSLPLSDTAIYGGLTHAERARLVRERAQAAAG